MRAQKCHRYKKIIIDGRITTYIYSYLNIYPVINKSHSRVSTTRWFYFTRPFFSLLSNKYISNISNLYNTCENSSLSPQTICEHMFSDPKSDHTFHIFWLRIWLIYFSSRTWKLSTYFKNGKLLEYIVSWISIESNGHKQEYYLPPKTEPNSKYYLENYFKNLVISVCSARDSGWGSLGGWVLGYSKDYKTKDSGFSFNQRI